jgi:hypothetical protein
LCAIFHWVEFAEPLDTERQELLPQCGSYGPRRNPRREEAIDDLALAPTATHFVVVEAKMFSPLTSGVKNAKYFNQAARNVSCIAETLRRARRPATELKILDFYVLAPRAQIEHSSMKTHLTKDDVRRVVRQRVDDCEGDMESWFSDWLPPALGQMTIKAVSWEELVDFLDRHVSESAGLRESYKRCIEHNGPRGSVQQRVDNAMPAVQT